MAEFKTEKQNNYGFPLTLSATGNFPLIAKRIWKTYSDAFDFVKNDRTACAGLVLTVIKDENKILNGAYIIIEGEDGLELLSLADKPTLEKILSETKQYIDKHIESLTTWEVYGENEKEEA